MLFKIHCFLVLVLITVTGLYAQDRAGIVNTNIVGTWISNQDNSVRIEFQENGNCNLYVDNVHEDELTYEVSNDDCTGSNSPIEITYLKRIYSDGDETCSEVSVRNDHMTIISYPRALISEYTRQ